jgi:hypothetical protein
MASEQHNKDELIGLSARTDFHEDTLMLIINKHSARPLSKARLLEELNKELRKSNKELWDENDLDISIALLTQKGLIEKAG